MAVQAPGQARCMANYFIIRQHKSLAVKGTVVCNVTSVQRPVWNHHTQGDGGHHGKLNLK